MVDLDRNTGRIVARLVGESGALDEVAGLIRDEAVREASKHIKTGEFATSFRIVEDTPPEGHGVTDRLVVNDDPDAQHIEEGHLAPNGTWVQGLHILRNAMLKFRQ